MSSYDSAIDRDSNRQVIQSNESFKTVHSITFTATGDGSAAAHDLFTVNGDVIVQVFGICNTNLASGGAATIEVGTANNTAALIAQTTATDIDDGKIWVDATPAVEVEGLPGHFIINDGADIVFTVGTTTITAGNIDFYCLWRPLSDGASIVAA